MTEGYVKVRCDKMQKSFEKQGTNSKCKLVIGISHLFLPDTLGYDTEGYVKVHCDTM